MVTLIISVLTICLAFLIYARYIRQKWLRFAQQKENIAPYLIKIAHFNEQFDLFLNQERYLSGYDIYTFKKGVNSESLFNNIRVLKYKHLPDYSSQIESIENFLQLYESLDKKIESKNKEFVGNEFSQTEGVLSNVEGNALDAQQRIAIFTEEDNQLAIAGAGTGKTTTIVGKVKYLKQRLNADLDKVLLLSFTRKSADELKERIKTAVGNDVTVNTFHKLGLDIISTVNNKKPNIYDSTGRSHLERIASFIENVRSKNDGSFSELVDFLSYHLKPHKDIFEFSTDAEFNNYLKEQKIEGYKIVEKSNRDGTVLKYRERFKSQEEMLIANFLFRNGINYKYEESYKYKTASKKFGQYKPDFYLPDFNLYLEHFGIDENGNVPNWFRGKENKSARQVYNEGIAWKRSEHQKNGTTLLETYSWQQKKGILLDTLKEKLLHYGVEFKPLTNEELWQYIKENALKDIDDFTQLINTFLVLFKSNNQSFEKLILYATLQSNKRAKLFLRIFELVFTAYQSYLAENEEIDFSDMINIATAFVEANNYTSAYNYIIIDEFQDISGSRYLLIKSLLNQRPQTKLFCVGDDWQSIYRFTGSDIGLFTGFKAKFSSTKISGFNRKTKVSYIDYTYRFNNKLIELTGNFILKNPNQIEKTLKSNKQSIEKPYTIEWYLQFGGDSEKLSNVVIEVLNDINERTNGESATVLLLGRYDFDRKKINTHPGLIERYNKSLSQYEYTSILHPSLKISFLTTHRSKGLQADYVVITNCNSGTYGFPSEISDDPLLNFLLSNADQFPNGEERRLFYVAMTRAKKHLYFLVSKEDPSKFINEIEANETVTSLKCEWCDNGKLIERNGPYGKFYACNNSHYCNFTRKIKPIDFKNIADEYYKQDNFDDALTQFNKYLEFEQNDSNTFFKIGRCHEHKLNIELANEYYTRSIELNRSNLYAFYWRGSTFYDLGNYQAAIDDWLHFKKTKGESNAINYWLANAYYNQGILDLTIEYLDKEISLSGNENARNLRRKILNS